MLHSAPDRRLPTITISQRGTSGNSSSEAATFLITAGITDYTQTTAINYLVDSLKNAGLWTKMKVIYPFIGGTAQAHQLNLKDPTINLLTFSGISHSSAGIFATNNAVIGSAVSAYSSVNDSTTDTSFGYYGTAIFTSSNNLLIGDGGQGVATNLIGVTTGGNNTLYYRAMNGGAGTGSTAYSSGFLGGDGFKMVSILGTTARVSTNQIENTPFTSSTVKGNLGWRLVTNHTNTPSNTYSFFFVGFGLTSAEMLTLHNIVGNYQGILGRQLYSFDSNLHPWTNRFKFTAGVTDTTQIGAVNQLVLDLENQGWLSSITVYPFVGSTLSAYAISLSATANGTAGNATWDPLGADPLVTTNAGIATGVNQTTLTSGGFLGFYCNENLVAGAASNWDVYPNASNTAGGGIGINLREGASNNIRVLAYAIGNTGGTIVGTNTNSIGSYHLQIQSGLGTGTMTLYKNAVPYTAVANGTGVTNTNIRIPGSPSNANSAGRRFAVSYIGAFTLTPAEISTLNTIIINYVTVLGRL
jgi:hypothetical protein